MLSSLIHNLGRSTALRASPRAAVLLDARAPDVLGLQELQHQLRKSWAVRPMHDFAPTTIAGPVETPRVAHPLVDDDILAMESRSKDNDGACAPQVGDGAFNI